MTTALIGLVGVIAGGVVTGGVQIIVATLDRRRASRTAARLLYMQLWWARSAMTAAAAHERWNPRIEWVRFIDAWSEHRADLARKLSTKDFLIVSAAFTGIEQLALMEADDLATPPPENLPSGSWFSVDAAGLIQTYDPYVQRAQLVLHRASFSRWEILRRKARAGEGEAISGPPSPSSDNGGLLGVADPASTPATPPIR